VDLAHYGDYPLTFYSTRPDHCDDTAMVQLEVRTAPVAFLPNAFTPNNDNINDTWPGELDIPGLGYEVHVFDRWGHSVWSTTDTAAKWDGANLPMGVYVYTMTMQDPCNPTDEVSKNGFITLFR
jgi:gliding motility-associated-like protein